MEGSNEVEVLKAEIEGWKRIAQGYQTYQERLLREIALFERIVGVAVASEVCEAANPIILDDEVV